MPGLPQNFQLNSAHKNAVLFVKVIDERLLTGDDALVSSLQQREEWFKVGWIIHCKLFHYNKLHIIQHYDHSISVHMKDSLSNSKLVKIDSPRGKNPTYP